MGKDNLKKLHSKSGKHFQVSDDAEPLIDYDSLQPTFSFRYMSYGSATCLSKCNKEIKSSIAVKLLRLSQLTWKDITSQPKEGNGFEPMPRERFKKPLPQTITPDVRIIVFRFSDSGRMAGFRSKDTFHIVQVGPHHNLY